MNAKRVLLVSSVLLWIINFGATAQDKYIPRPNEKPYGTCTNKQYDPTWQEQKAVFAADGYKNYPKVTDTVPAGKSTLHIDAK